MFSRKYIFSGNANFQKRKMYSGCLAISEIVLRKINSSVWFVQTFLQKMLYIAKPPNFPYTSSAVNMRIMNQFHTHSQKKQNPAKKFIKSDQIKIARWRRRWDRAVEARSESRSSDEIGGEIERHGAAIEDRHGAIVGLELGLWSPAKSLLPLFLRSGLSLSLSGNTLKWKWKCKMISVVKAFFFRSTKINFRKILFSEPTKHPHFWKSVSESDFHPKQTHPKAPSLTLGELVLSHALKAWKGLWPKFEWSLVGLYC